MNVRCESEIINYSVLDTQLNQTSHVAFSAFSRSANHIRTHLHTYTHTHTCKL